jgi:hypothetical protein
MDHWLKTPVQLLYLRVKRKFPRFLPWLFHPHNRECNALLCVLKHDLGYGHKVHICVLHTQGLTQN